MSEPSPSTPLQDLSAALARAVAGWRPPSSPSTPAARARPASSGGRPRRHRRRGAGRGGRDRRGAARAARRAARSPAATRRPTWRCCASRAPDPTPVRLDTARSSPARWCWPSGAQRGRADRRARHRVARGPEWRSCAAARSTRASSSTSAAPQQRGRPRASMRRPAFGMAVFGPRRRVLVIPAATIERVAAQFETPRPHRARLSRPRAAAGRGSMTACRRDGDECRPKAGRGRGRHPPGRRDRRRGTASHCRERAAAAARPRARERRPEGRCSRLRRGGEPAGCTITVGERPAVEPRTPRPDPCSRSSRRPGARRSARGSAGAMSPGFGSSGPARRPPRRGAAARIRASPEPTSR